MQILVTGHNGYIGTILVPMLLNAGHDVVGLDSNVFKKCTYMGEIREVPEIVKDIRDVTTKDIEGYDAIIHLAGLSNDPLGDLNPALTLAINHEGSVRLAKLAKAVGISRFIFSSSCSNYGAGGDKILNETSVLKPMTPYGESKVLVEQSLSKLADSSFTPVYLRNATAYGVSPRLRFDLVLNNLVAWAVTTKRIFLKSDGTPWRPLVHIEDISRAFMSVLNAPRDLVHNQAFNIGVNDENYRMSELAEIVAQIVPGCRIEYAADAGPDKRCYRVDCTKVRHLVPEFKPHWNVRKGAEELYETYKRVGLTHEEFEGSRFSRIAHIKHLLNSGELTADLRWCKTEPVQNLMA